MFNQLLKLYRQNSKKTPLEDYTTEIFVGVLNSDLELKKSFCEEFLGLNSLDYKISTQRHYYLENEPKCIVDVVIEGDSDVCFIENKVNSNEGDNQLERYGKVLENIKTGKKINTKLCYCTKKYDEKKIADHNFQQFKWHHIAKYFSKFQNEKLTQHFVKFLKTNDMSNDMIIEATDLITLNKLTKTLNLVQRNILNVKSIFSTKFKVSYDGSHGMKMLSQLNAYDRICIASFEIAQGEGHSEILYGIEMRGNLVIQLYIKSVNPNHKMFAQIIKEKDKTTNKFKTEFFDHGSSIYLEKNLGVFINDEDSENKIGSWFIEGFDIIGDFLVNTSADIEWNNSIIARQKKMVSRV